MNNEERIRTVKLINAADYEGTNLDKLILKNNIRELQKVIKVQEKKIEEIKMQIDSNKEYIVRYSMLLDNKDIKELMEG